MPKYIIWVRGNPAINAYKRREYLWSESHKCYIYLGKEFSAEEFNQVVEKALRKNYDMRPSVKIMLEGAPAPELPDDPPAAPPPPAPPAPAEITADQAEEALRRLAPERLKKKPAAKTGQ